MSEDKKYVGKKMTFLNFALFPFAFAGAYFAVKYAFTYNYASSDCKYTKLMVKEFPTTKWGFEQKLNLLLLSGAATAVFLLITVLSTMVGRIFSGRSGIGGKSQEDNLFISTCNRILKNTIEQSFIFYGLYAYWLFNVSGNTGEKVSKVEGKDKPLAVDKAVIENGKTAVLFAVLFLSSRIVFYFGYMIHLFTKIFVVRGIGFLVGMFVNLMILQRILGLENKYKLW